MHRSTRRAYERALFAPLTQESDNMPDAPKRKHRATYAKDKRNGGFNVRIVGPYPNRFAGKDIPVTKKDGTEEMRTLGEVLWTGPDTDVQTHEPTGLQAALYSVAPRPQNVETEVEF